MFGIVMWSFGALIALVIALHVGLTNGSIRDYLDKKNDPDVVPAAEFYIAHGYYLFHDLENSATYFARIPERFPKSDYAEESAYYYARSIDESNVYSRQQVIDEYARYLENYPTGRYYKLADARLASIKNVN